jgi:hypothetical protein
MWGVNNKNHTTYCMFGKAGWGLRKRTCPVKFLPNEMRGLLCRGPHAADPRKPGIMPGAGAGDVMEQKSGDEDDCAIYCYFIM